MSLGVSVRETLPALQAAAESLMTTFFVVEKPGQPGQIPPGGTRVGDTWVRAGETYGRVGKANRADEMVSQVGSADATRVSHVLHLPLRAFTSELVPGWRFRVTQVGALDDFALLGSVYTVVAVEMKTYATARRVDVAQVTAGQG